MNQLYNTIASTVGTPIPEKTVKFGLKVMNQLYNTIASTVGGTSDSRLLSRFRDRSY